MDTNLIAPKRKINVPWLFRMALRDSRRNRSRLLLFISAIVFGIAALVAIYSFKYNVQNDINDQAATLIGADLAVSGNKPSDIALKHLLDSLGEDRSTERSFPSMLYFPRTMGTRLVQIRALQGGFPYYGSLETTPEIAGTDFKNGRMALVDKTLMLQFNARVGDSVKVGNLTFKIAGILNKAPGQSGAMAGIAPVVYIPMQYLEQTGLVKIGSRVMYSYYYKLDKQTDLDKLIKKLEPMLDKDGLHYDTIETKKENTGRAFDDLSRFLSLIGFVALLLGCVGVASSIQIYIKEKIASIAIMRCLGVRASEAFLIYLIQIVGIGIIGSVIGSVLGAVIQHLLPVVFKDFIPFAISTQISWMAIGQGVLLGVIIAVLFALLPLISIRNISPLNTLRMAVDEGVRKREPLRWLVYLLILAFVLVFSYLQLDSWVGSVFFTLGILIAFGILTLTAWLLMRVTKAIIQGSWSYLWRQGFANLYRPNNQTIILIVSIGLSTMFICTLLFVQSLLIKQVNLSTSSNQANMILFDIQSSQEKGVVALTKKEGLPVLQQVPIVTLRIEEINGKTATDLIKDTTIRIKHSVFANEYRVTFRDSLSSSETLLKGTWIGKADAGKDVPVSIEDNLARRADLKIGDKMIFNVQGLQMPAYVASIRKVNWGKIQTNFQVLFPTGVLEDAPQFDVLMTHVPSNKSSAAFQQVIVKNYPNVSIIDLGLLLNVVDDLLSKISYVINFMSAFSIITGVVVLIASVRISKYQRIQESVLLRTLGASRRQIFAITSLEYMFLGSLSALTGILIAFAGTWFLAKYSFNMPYSVNILPALMLFLIVSVLTVIIGLLNSRGVLNKPPLEILRTNA